MFAAQKLLIGKLLAAWVEYPETRKELLEVRQGSPILVTGTHRSGTTWVGNMLASSGIWHCHEPFGPYKGKWQEWFTYANANVSRPDIDSLISGVLKGKHRELLDMKWVEHPLMPLRLLPQPVHRILIKDPIACLMSEYLTNRFDMHTLVLFRHPAAFVESVMRLGWPQQFGIRLFLENIDLMHDFLYPYEGLMASVQDSGDLKAAAVMHGCLNTVLWAYVKRNSSMKSLCFEDLCMDPLHSFVGIFSELGLTYNDKVKQRHESMCHSDKYDGRKAHAIHRQSNAMAYGWKQRMDQHDIDRVRTVWEHFDIPLYKNDSEW